MDSFLNLGESIGMVYSTESDVYYAIILMGGADTPRVYYDDIKHVKNGNRNISTLKFLSKEYSEFSDLSFRSDLDLVVNKLEKIKTVLET